MTMILKDQRILIQKKYKLFLFSFEIPVEIILFSFYKNVSHQSEIMSRSKYICM